MDEVKIFFFRPSAGFRQAVIQLLFILYKFECQFLQKSTNQAVFPAINRVMIDFLFPRIGQDLQ
ncbi:hypothetical protein ABR335_09010 [Heyndrickxia faecalis]|uniref:Uncharacterized protein n=1 Tax=Heyndrickxia faecalis TaxID=2824910 RepID=A0AAU7WDW1_9BACI